MEGELAKPLAAFGFLTVLESPVHGLFGGYLVLSPQGRPLEFRCSTPVVPSRAQQILYGPTLRQYLLSEVIGKTLLESAEIPVSVVLTNERDMLPLAALRPENILHVAPRAEGQGAPRCDVDSPPTDSQSQYDSGQDTSRSHSIGPWRIETYSAVMRTAEQLHALVDSLAAHVDLCEPFERILAALAEAQLSSLDAEDPRDERSAA